LEDLNDDDREGDFVDIINSCNRVLYEEFPSERINETKSDKKKSLKLDFLYPRTFDLSDEFYKDNKYIANKIDDIKEVISLSSPEKIHRASSCLT